MGISCLQTKLDQIKNGRFVAITVDQWYSKGFKISREVQQIQESHENYYYNSATYDISSKWPIGLLQWASTTVYEDPTTVYISQ